MFASACLKYSRFLVENNVTKFGDSISLLRNCQVFLDKL